jgi:RNA polymerase sigma-70 factor (ECF subfamily)
VLTESTASHHDGFSPSRAHRDHLERLIVAGDRDRATTLALRTYGPELIGWLGSLLATEADAYEAFSLMSEDLWRSLVRFDGRCSMRTWCYMLARHAAGRVRVRARRAREHLVPEIPSVAHEVTELWSSTERAHRREQDVYAELRAALAEEDQLLLVLRVDRGLAWREIAQVMLGEGAGDEDLTRKAAALRKQFERVKVRLKELAATRLAE